MKKKILLSALLLTSVQVSYALPKPINGLYVGVNGAASYIGEVQQIPVPAMPPLTTGASTISLQSKVGGSFGLFAGYRVKEKFRIETEIYASFNTPRQIEFPSGVVVDATDTYAPNGNFNTNAALMINAFYDMLPGKNSERSYQDAAPYFGIGVGKAMGTNKVIVNRNGVEISTPINSKQTVSIVQAIVGVGSFLDDYTSVGIDFRVQKSGTIEQLNQSYTKYNLNFTAKFALAD
jgi:hypothetical protein